MSVKEEVTKGLKWTTTSTVVLALVALLKISILTRYLEKSDFGLMALVTFVMNFMQLFNDMGLTSAILYKKDITKKEYASLYWLNWFVSILLFIILLIIAPFISKFYDQPLLTNLISLLGINILITSLGRQFKTVEQKHLLFKFVSIVDMIGAILSLILSIILAIYNYGVYTLVYSLLFQTFFSNLAYFILGIKKYKLLLHFNIKETVLFLKIGMYQVGGQIVNYFNRDLDILIIGKIFSPDILGGYSLAKDLVTKPASIIRPILSKVGAPSLAKVNFDHEKLKRFYLKMTNILASITIPMYLLIAIFAYPIIYILYGSNFVDITILVQILTINMVFRVISGNIGNLIIATGRTDLDFKWNILILIVAPLFIYIGSLFNVIGVAFMVSFSMIILYIPGYYFLVRQLIDVSLKEYSKAFFLIRPFKF